MEDRYHWEMLVLSACIEDKKAFLMVGSYLKEQNFMFENHRMIWLRMNDLYPHKPINLLSFKDIVSLEVIIKITRWYCPLSNVLYYAALIIECDIRANAIALMDKIYNQYYVKNPLTHDLVHVFEEIKARLANNWIDLFETMDEIKEGFKNDEVYELARREFDLFFENVEKRMFLIKKQSKVQLLFEHLSSLDHLSTCNRLVLQKLGQIAQYALNGTLPKEIETLILSSKLI